MQTCTLCSTEIPRNPIFAEEKPFCCHGCQAVFSILAAKNALQNYQEHPIFRQALSSGIISNPALLENLKTKETESQTEKQKITFEVGDMWCPSCAEVIGWVLMQEKGVLHCIVDYTTDLASVQYCPLNISKEKIFELVRSLGYRAVAFDDPNRKAVSFSLYLRFIVAAFCAVNVMMFSYPIYASYFDPDMLGYAHLFSWLSFGISLPVLCYSAFPIFRRFWNSLKVGFFGMEALVTIGICSSFLLSLYELWKGSDQVYFDSMTVIIAFVLLGKIVEAKAKFSTKENLIQLNRALPRRGRKQLTDGSEAFFPIKEIEVGDHVVALMGEKIVLDGVVIAGEGNCDESVLTGETWPQTKKVGSQLLAGSVVQNGKLVYRITHSHTETTLQQIIATIEKEIGHKSTYVRAADQIVQWFVPVVVVLACIAGGFVFFAEENIAAAIVRAMSVLLISCPCAIGIAAPLAETCLINRMAEAGAIVRNRACLAILGRESVFVFDKTGTVTTGKLSCTIPLIAEEELSILKAMTSYSTHLVSQAIYSAIDVPAAKLDRIEEIIGKGLVAYTRGHEYSLGSLGFNAKAQRRKERKESFLTKKDSLRSLRLCAFALNPALQTQTITIFSKDKTCLAEIELQDETRKEAPEVIQGLYPTKTLLLSGDSPNAVEQVAQACGFTEWQSRCSPLEKQQVIRELKEKKEIVCMLGDGINDAPALTEAHVSISVVNATAISAQVSDILLTSDNLATLLVLRKLARKGQKIVKQNLFWAFFYNVLGIGLAMCGFLSPLFAAAAMTLSSLIVILNVQRIETK